MADIDYTSRDYEAFRHELLERLDEKIPEYTDFSESDAGVVLSEALAVIADIISYYNDKTANELFFETQRERENALKLARYLAYQPRTRNPARYKQVFEIEPQDEEVVIPEGFKVYTDDSETEEELPFETQEELVIPAGDTGLETDENGEYIHTVEVAHGETITEEILGSSDGSAYQSFELNREPAIADSVEVFVNEGLGFERWQRVDTFIGQADDSRVYRLREKSDGQVVVEFGSGFSGKIPEERENNIMADYRVGGGSEGNVGVNTITEMKTEPYYIKDTFNPYEAEVVGRDGETLEEIQVNAPASVRTNERLVRLDDYEDMALGMDEVTMAQAVPGDDFREIDVYILPFDLDEMSDTIEQMIYNRMDEVDLIGYDLVLKNPNFIEIELDIDLFVSDRYRQDGVIDNVEEAIDDFFERGNFGFAENFEVSQLVAFVMTETNGVNGINIDVSCPDDPDCVEEGRVEIEDGEIVRLDDYEMDVEGGYE